MESETLKAAVAGAGAGLVTDLVFYSIDSYKTQLQAKDAHVNLRKLFRGFWFLTLSGTVPSFGVFFAIYHPSKAVLLQTELKPYLAVLVSSIVAGVPASIVAVPADAMKKQLVLGRSDSPRDALVQLMRKHNGIGGIFVGWKANLIRDVPFAAVKLSLFEGMVHQYEARMGHSTSTMACSALGVATGITTAVLTCPLDVVNTRIKDVHISSPHSSITRTLQTIIKTEGSISLFKGLVPRTVILGAGSGIFWGVHAQIQSVLTTHTSFNLK